MVGLDLDADGRGQFELQACFRGQAEVLLSRRGNGGTRNSANDRANQGPLPASGNPADDRAEAGTAADLSRAALPLALALDGRIFSRDLIDAAAERQRVELQQDLIAALELTG